MNADGGKSRRLTRTRTPYIYHTPAWSPDAKRIAFDRERLDPLNGNRAYSTPSQIYVMNADGSSLRRLTRTRVWAHDPTWSPNGKRIAFDTGSWNNLQISVMNADGSNPHRLTPKLAISYSPARYRRRRLWRKRTM